MGETKNTKEGVAEHEASEFKRVFSAHQIPENMPEFELPSDILNAGKCDAATLLKATNAFPSMGELKRLIKQGGIKVNDIKINDQFDMIELKSGMIIKIGKLKFFKLK